MISAVVLTHNDEMIISRCLESVAWCDEVIVIDDESTDMTVNIAKKSSAKVYSRALNDDFASQRNFGLSKAKNEWVLFVDSDEVISAELAAEIGSKLQLYTSDVYGYFVRRVDRLWGRELRHGETANVKLLRFAKKTAGTWVRPVHEVWDVNGEIGELKHPLLHYPHPDVAQFLAQINRYSTLNATHLYASGVRTSFFHVIAYPSAKFFVNYFWRLGFLDGIPGALVAILMSFHSFLSRAKLWQLSQHKQKTS